MVCFRNNKGSYFHWNQGKEITTVLYKKCFYLLTSYIHLKLKVLFNLFFYIHFTVLFE